MKKIAALALGLAMFMGTTAKADVQFCEKKVKELSMLITKFGSRLTEKPVDFEITQSFTATRSHPIYGEINVYDVVGLGRDTLDIKGSRYVIQLDGTCSLISIESKD